MGVVVADLILMPDSWEDGHSAISPGETQQPRGVGRYMGSRACDLSHRGQVGPVAEKIGLGDQGWSYYWALAWI